MILVFTALMRPLSDLEHKKYARIVSFNDDSLMASCCIEMGLCEDSVIQVLDKLSFGGNLIILSENGKYTLRKKEADQIMVSEIIE